MIYSKICGWCKKEYKSNRLASAYCSQVCHFSFRKSISTSQVSLNCSACGNTFTKDQHRVRINNYCSKKCSGIGRRNDGPWSATPSEAGINARRNYFRQYIESNREKINLLSNEWGKRNKVYKNILLKTYRAAGSLTRKEKEEIIKNAGCCVHCKSTKRLEVDHILAVTKGGKSIPSNLQVLCRSYNASKGSGLTSKMPKVSKL